MHFPIRLRHRVVVLDGHAGELARVFLPLPHKGDALRARHFGPIITAVICGMNGRDTV